MADDNRIATDKLLKMYENYKKIDKEKEVVASRLAKAKVRGAAVQDLLREHSSLGMKLQELSDEMTFASPIIWMMYKYEAYIDEAQPIRTMQDFRVHCSKPGYICTKRFDFVNEQLNQRNVANLNDHESYQDELPLSEVFSAPVITELVNDQSFQQQWRHHEYNKNGQYVAKWENYS